MTQASPDFSQSSPPSVLLQKWVERLRLDIASRGLPPGEPYLTARAAGELLGCSRATAHRAMSQLIREGLLVSRPGSGTYIGKQVADAPAVQVLMVAMPMGFLPCTSIPLSRMMQQIGRELGNLGVVFNVFPENAPLHYIAETIVKPYRAGQVATVVAVGCHWTVQQQLREQGVKALVLGSWFPDRRLLDSVDKDSVGAGWLLVDHLISHGHKRIGVVAPASGLAGVDLLVDAISQRFASYQLAEGALTLRFCNGDEPVTLDRIREMLSAEPGQRPTAMITSEADFATQIAEVATSLGLEVGRDLEIVFEGSLLRTEGPSSFATPFTHTHTELSDAALLHELVQRVKALRVLQPDDEVSTRVYDVVLAPAKG